MAANKRFILPVLFLLTGFQRRGLFLVNLFLSLPFLFLYGLKQLLGLLRGDLRLLP